MQISGVLVTGDLQLDGNVVPVVESVIDYDRIDVNESVRFQAGIWFRSEYFIHRNVIADGSVYNGLRWRWALIAVIRHVEMNPVTVVQSHSRPYIIAYILVIEQDIAVILVQYYLKG